MAQTVNNLPAKQETWVQSLGKEDPWRRKRLPILPWRIPWTGATVPGAHKESDMPERLTLSFSL